MKKIINVMRKIKASFSRRTTRRAFSESLLCGCPYALALDSAGSLYGGEFGASTVGKITPVGTNCVVTTLAGRA